MEPVHNLLSPRILTENDDSYVSVVELEYVLTECNCNNIAITGPFGSGKSSILRTLTQVDKEHHYLNISLATLDENRNDIEYCIVQQLIYKADEDKICQSRFSKIKYLKPREITSIACKIILLVLSLIIAFEPSWLLINGIYDLYYSIFDIKYGQIINMIADVLCAGYMLYCLFLIIRIAIRKLYNIKLEKLNIKEGSVDFSKEASAFNKHLDEILYFFKATDYTVVVFEDLDRFDDSKKLFLKLREINCLINDSEYFKKEKKNVKFVYAIKDEIFDGETRTKYFDYIISAIPVVNSINSGDYLIKTYGTTDIPDKKNKYKFEISSQQYLELGSYIEGMRELHNIINEFIQYKNQIGANLPDYKLFAITVYKNKYPDDYAQLHNKSGVLYGSIESKMKFAEIANRVSVSSRLELKQKCLEEKAKICRIREPYIKQLQADFQATALEVSGRRIAIDDVKDDDDAFWHLQNNLIHTIYVRNDNGTQDVQQNYNYNFQDLSSSVTPDISYDECVSQYENNINAYNSKIHNLERDINTILRSSLSSIIKQIANGEEALNVIVSIYKTIMNVTDESLNPETYQMCKMILFLLRNDYIDECYSSYISYFYPGSLYAEDNDYLQSLMLGISKGYEYNLKDPNAVIKKMQVEYFNTKNVLNYHLLDELMRDKVDNSVFLKCFLDKVKENYDFIKGYSEKGDHIKEFFEYLLSDWSAFIDVALNKTNIDFKDTFLILFYQYCKDPSLFRKNKDQLGDTYTTLVNHISVLDITVVEKIISTLSITFNKLIAPNTDTEELYQYVLSKNRFEINLHNLRLIFGAEFDTHSYTSILSYGNKAVVKYINDNIIHSIAAFSETSTEESKDALVKLINNESLLTEIKTAYIAKQKAIIENLSGVGRENAAILLNTDHIVPKWSNIIEYYDLCEHQLPEELRAFIERQAARLSKEDVYYESDNSVADIFISLFAGDILSIETYQMLINQFNEVFSNAEHLNVNSDRLSILISSHKIDYSSEIAIYIEKNYSSRIFADFLITKFADFLSKYDNVLTICNEAGIYILQSHLALVQKIEFLDDVATITEDDKYTVGYANEICFYYAEAGITNDSDIELIKEALKLADNWSNKIRVVNSVNKNCELDFDNLKYMLNTLGDEYAKLNALYKRPRFDNNPENATLIDFLKTINYISSSSVDNQQIYVVCRYTNNI